MSAVPRELALRLRPALVIPHLGRYRLANVDGPLLRGIFAKIAKIQSRKGVPQSPSEMQHLRNTLRAALNLAVREGLIDSNPTRHIEVTGYQRPYAKIWTDGRVEHGNRPASAQRWRTGPPGS